MGVSIATIIIALVLVFIAWKVLTGLLKVGAIVLVIALAVYFLAQGGF
jgi:hypothetical protein